MFIAITGLEHVQAYGYECKSWAWQLAQGVNKELLKPALRFVIRSTEPEPVLTIAARAAFWRLPRALLTDIAELKGYSLVGCTELFEVLFALVKQALAPIEDEDVMTILEKRGAALYRKQAGVTKLITEVDEAAACLEEEDREDFQKSQDTAKADALETEEFNKAWGKRYMKLHGGSPQSAKKSCSCYVWWQEENGCRYQSPHGSVTGQRVHATLQLLVEVQDFQQLGLQIQGFPLQVCK